MPWFIFLAFLAKCVALVLVVQAVFEYKPVKP